MVGVDVKKQGKLEEAEIDNIQKIKHGRKNKMVTKRKKKLFALTYHPQKDKWSSKVVKKIPKKVGRNTSLVRGTSKEDAWMRLSRASYYGETGKKLRKK